MLQRFCLDHSDSDNAGKRIITDAALREQERKADNLQIRSFATMEVHKLQRPPTECNEHRSRDTEGCEEITADRMY